MNLNRFNVKKSSIPKQILVNKYSSMGFRASNVLSAKDYYSILGVPKNADKADIKKAYFQKAKKFHPDVNKEAGSKEKFSEINEAYETLGDEQKRQVYDHTGMTGDEQAQAGGGPGGPFGGFGGPGGPGGNFWEHFSGAQGQGGFPGGPGGAGSFRDIFEDFEDFFNMGQKSQGKTRQQPQVKGKDVVLNIEIEFMEAVNGTQKTVSYNKIDNCSR